ncbi:uncharacterized protein LOC103313297 [Tribolium castaneum]|uniref:Uncharacterized protein n=1 Tax=Tribolium castaneum TaxID=7070 RepID=D2A4J5_TRICA|nr:PREDICTED: uncharacterized protein LOC103313297 [Tribolium castaneum]EFA05212.1 hypothetical protein TcasGA2_TC015352 [Tribolium castaneum]|eukprot:XP_008194465.1 PREDICTED: uncharacterized protein LOC103313297 [Tribolium castaneum]
MPEMGADMYCSQQICIPPTFPYLLRQFAKAAIRTQPNDLLKWATTYFRCLSLNIPPPVKPRLEYPIPRDHHGLTPGWLRALLYQMAGHQTVTFKTLWDRWIGACLQHPNLIQILVLGGFDDNQAVPWLRFIALCAAHLTDSLTQTMILICEILTEEPEGGSAMIPLSTFLDLYEFLARIDASLPQTLKNYYFLDKFLELFREKIAKDSGEKPVEEELETDFMSEIVSEVTEKSERETKKDDEGSVVSCPSVTSQDPDNYMKLLMKIRAEGEFEESNEEIKEETEEKTEPVDEEVKEEEVEERKESVAVSEKKFPEQLAEDEKIPQFPVEDDLVSKSTRMSSAPSESLKKDEEDLKQDTYLMEDLARLRSLQEAMMGESDDEVEKFKASILAEAGLTQSQIDAPEHFETRIESEIFTNESLKSYETSTSEPSVKEKAPEIEYEDVFVDPVPGIGPKVPENLILAVCNYMKDVAKWQHDMVMPRNIRHFDRPPLEIRNQ